MRDEVGCGRCVRCSPHATLSVWRECRGERATGRSRGEGGGGWSRTERRVLHGGKRMRMCTLTVWQTDWGLCECVCAFGVCVCLVRRSSQSCRSCWLLHATCIRSHWPPAHTKYEYIEKQVEVTQQKHTDVIKRHLGKSFHTLGLATDYFYLQYACEREGLTGYFKSIPQVFSVFYSGDEHSWQRHPPLWRHTACKSGTCWEFLVYNWSAVTRRSSFRYLIDEPAHPRAGRQHEQSVREEDEVAFV